MRTPLWRKQIVAGKVKVRALDGNGGSQKASTEPAQARRRDPIQATRQNLVIDAGKELLNIDAQHPRIATMQRRRLRQAAVRAFLHATGIDLRRQAPLDCDQRLRNQEVLHHSVRKGQRVDQAPLRVADPKRSPCARSVAPGHQPSRQLGAARIDIEQEARDARPPPLSPRRILRMAAQRLRKLART